MSRSLSILMEVLLLPMALMILEAIPDCGAVTLLEDVVEGMDELVVLPEVEGHFHNHLIGLMRIPWNYSFNMFAAVPSLIHSFDSHPVLLNELEYSSLGHEC